MKKTEYGLKIRIDELEEILKRAKNEYEYHDKEYTLYFKDKEVIQYCVYHDCTPAVYR